MPGCDGTGTAERNYPISEARGGGGVVVAGRQPRGVTPHPRPGEVPERTNPMCKEPWLCGHRRA